MALYRIDDKNKLVITIDFVGDSKDIHVYKFSDFEIKEVAVDGVIPNVVRSLIKSPALAMCDSASLPTEVSLEFDLSKKDRIIVRNPYHTIENDSQCFSGNTIMLSLDARVNKFLIDSVLWKTGN